MFHWYDPDDDFINGDEDDELPEEIWDSVKIWEEDYE